MLILNTPNLFDVQLLDAGAKCIPPSLVSHVSLYLKAALSVCGLG